MIPFSLTERIAWMRKLLPWAMIGARGDRLIIELRYDTPRPPR